jgi:hypothetical protein
MGGQRLAAGFQQRHGGFDGLFSGQHGACPWVCGVDPTRNHASEMLDIADGIMMQMKCTFKDNPCA